MKFRNSNSFRPGLEALENRLVPTVAVVVNPIPISTIIAQETAAWFQANLTDPGMQSLGLSDYQRDGTITRNDMLGVFAEIEAKGAVTSAEMHDLKVLAANVGPFGPLMPAYVQYLTARVANGDPANATYQAMELVPVAHNSGINSLSVKVGVSVALQEELVVSPLGNLYVGSSAVQLEDLVNKWFLGMDLPTMDSANYNYAYDSAASLYGSGISNTDIQQGYLGDCYFLSSLADLAHQSPSTISNMIIDNGDGTYTIRFFDNGVAAYTTVNRWLPDDANGNFVYADIGQSLSDPTVKLWVPLLEKAYAQVNQSGWLGRNGTDSYAGLTDGWAGNVFPQITGLSATKGNALSNQNTLTTAVTSGELVCLNTPGSGYLENIDGYSIVEDHVYSVQGYSPSTGLFTLYNPWGYDANLQSLSAQSLQNLIQSNTNAFGASVVLQLNWTQITQIFSSWDEGTNPSAPVLPLPVNSLTVEAGSSELGGKVIATANGFAATPEGNTSGRGSPAISGLLGDQTWEALAGSLFATGQWDHDHLAVADDLDPLHVDAFFTQAFRFAELRK
jgi:hypothetical protein